MDAATLQAQLATLLDARANGTRRVSFNGREVEYDHGTDLAAAIADTERRLAALNGRKVPRIVNIRTKNGW